MATPDRLVASALVSTIAESPSVTDETAAPASPTGPSSPLRLTAVLILTVLLVAIAFTTGGGVDEVVASSGNTWTEIALTLLGLVAVSAELLSGDRSRRRHGQVTVALMVVLFALEAASIAWSVLPDSSWLASGQMLAYLAAFAGAASLARLIPSGWQELLWALVLAAAALCAWSLLVKVFPISLATGNTLQVGRLQAPFGYWNAIALTAAVGLPGCLWLGARRESGRLAAAVATVATSLIVAVLVLSYSRSADLAAVVAVGLWLAFVPLRLRAIAMLAVGAVGGAVISVWGLAHQAITGGGVAPGAQDHAGHIFGIVIIVVLVAMAGAGVAAAGRLRQTTISDETRRNLGRLLFGLLIAVVLAVVLAVAVSPRGLPGEISHGWQQLTNPQATISANSAGRVFKFGSSRPVYWHEALAVGDHSVFKGVGANGFSAARLRYSSDSDVVFQAHSYVFETYADLGILGLLVTAALLGSWLLATGRTLRVRRPRSVLSPGERAERTGLLTLAAAVVGFGVQSTLDWTWFFTGVAVPALLAAGWLAGRGPLDEPTTAAAARRPSPLDRPAALALVTLLSAAVLAGCFMVWRPLHSADLVSELESGTSSNALATAHAAHRADPFSLAPVSALASLYEDAHRPGEAQRVLQAATRQQPDNLNTWEPLAQFFVDHHRWRDALIPVQKVQQLNLSGDAQATINDHLIIEVARHLKSPG